MLAELDVPVQRLGKGWSARHKREHGANADLELSDLMYYRNGDHGGV